jgi:hypothetical protein
VINVIKGRRISEVIGGSNPRQGVRCEESVHWNAVVMVD